MAIVTFQNGGYFVFNLIYLEKNVGDRRFSEFKYLLNINYPPF